MASRGVDSGRLAQHHSMKLTIRLLPFFTLLLIAALFLAGCLSTSQLTDEQRANLTPEAKLYGLYSDYVTALKALSPYLDQPYCSQTIVIACKERDIVERLQELDYEICGPPPPEGQRGCSQTSAFGIAQLSDGNSQVAAIHAVRALMLRFSGEIARLKVQT